MVHDSLIICLYTFYPPAPQIATIKCRKVSRLSFFASAKVRKTSKNGHVFDPRMSVLILIYFLRLSMKQAAAETASAAPQSRTGLSSPVFGRFSALGSFFHSAVSVTFPVTVIVSPA